MQLRFFAVPVLGGEEIARELNQFLSTERVIMVERTLVADGSRSLWAVCVGYADRGARTGPGSPASGSGQRVDYREVLSEGDFRVYVKLRDLRKELADRDGVPPYAVFTNEHLAAMVQQRVRSLAALERIPGIGAARVKKYGAAFLEVLTARTDGAPAVPSNGEIGSPS
jgi:superfamily II DNA helicase RecQ